MATTTPTKSGLSNFISKVNDGGLWPLILPIGGIIFLLVSAFFHLNNDYSKYCAIAPTYEKILGLVFMGAAGFSIKASIGEDWHIPGWGWGMICFVFLALGILSLAGFFVGVIN